MTPRPKPRRPAPVLRLGEDRAEWLDPPGAEPSGDRGDAGDPGSPGGYGGYGLARADACAPAALAEAARAARELCQGGRPGAAARRACVLALGGGLVRQRTLELPPLAARERHGVCLRKAANLLGTPPSDTLFCAVAGVAVDGGRRRWLVACLRRSFLRELLHELAARGVRVARVVCARQAALALLHDGEQPAPDAAAAIAIDAEPDELVVSLVARGRLVAQNVVPGHFDQGALNARMLLAEVRSQAAYQRLTSRGELVERVLLVGSAHERLAPLAQVLRAVVPGADVTTAPCAAPGPADERAARAAVLDACRRRGPFELDLTPDLAPRARRIAGWAAASAGVALALGSLAHGRAAHELAELERSTVGLAAVVERGSAALDASARARTALERAARALESVRAVERAGWSLDDLLADALAALDDQAALRALTTGAAGPGAEVELSAWTDGDPLEVSQRVARVTAALEAGVVLRGCTSEPEPASLDPARAADAPFGFRVRAVCDAAPDLEPDLDPALDPERTR